ncbi:immunity 49 family protein [Thermomonospora amylolytica]|uniref:immunity 49 family protein n=1 Tax=Thermomonospora amylolytica TaxID=1411117 RepID=UPI000E6B7432|nr:immunity 49 family protein [Thermomonospora amylolytica]
MQTVPRHDIDQDFAAQQVEACERRILERHLPIISEHPEGVRRLFDSALMLMRYRCALDPAATLSETWESVTLAMQAGAAMFAAGLRTEGTVEVVIRTSRVAIPATGVRTWTNVDYWLDALYLAMICREKERTDLLCSVSPDFLRASEIGGVVDPYVHPWVESLQRFWRGEPDVYDRLGNALDLANPQEGDPDGDVLALQALPPMVLFDHLLSGAHDDFNIDLYHGLQGHRAFWGRSPEYAQDCDGYVSLPLLAMAGLAHGKGVPIEVESPYIPKGLVDGGWVGEFPT